MTVAGILAKKGRCVVTTRPHRTLQEAAKELTEHKIAALVVTGADDKVVGLISEREIIKAVAHGGPGALSEPVWKHMDGTPRFVAETDTVDQTMETMTRERRRHLPVMREGRLSGIVSIGDVVKSRLDLIEAERKALQQYIATA